jgi:hypothetical protein
MIVEGISIMDLMQLGKAVKDKKLTLQIKVLDGEWKDLDKDQFKNMLEAIMAGQLTTTADIRARLYSKT